MKHVLDDRFCADHFFVWLDDQTKDTEEWLEVYSAIYDLLCEEPNLIQDHSWPEMRRLTGV